MTKAAMKARRILAGNFDTWGAQSALARSTGITRQAVSRWMVGLNAPSGLTVIRMVQSDDPAVHEAGIKLLNALHPELASLANTGAKATPKF